MYDLRNNNEKYNYILIFKGAPNSITGGIPKSRSLENTKKLARHLNCPVDSNQNMMMCLQAKPMMDIVNYTGLEYNSTERFFTPIYGDELAPMAPIEALKLGRFNQGIDLLYGVTDEEGSMFALNMFPHYANATNLTIDSVKKDIVRMSEIYYQTFGSEVADYYTKDLKNPTQDELKYDRF